MTPLAESVLAGLLQAGGEYRSAAELLPLEGRAQVWNAVQELRAAGCHIEGRTRRGYRLTDTSALVHPSTVEPFLTTRRVGRFFETLAQTDSTNREIKARADSLPDGAVIWADRQTAGRGRQGRSWNSDAGSALQFSVLWKPLHMSASTGALVTQVAGAALARALDFCPLLGIKWPNDLMAGGKKLCGILAEMMTDGEEVAWICIGVGLNVNQLVFPADLPHAGSLALATGRSWARGPLLARLLNNLERELEVFEARGPKAALDLCREKSTLLGHQITCEGGGGLAVGLDDAGRLLVRDCEGNIRALLSGEAHLGSDRGA